MKSNENILDVKKDKKERDKKQRDKKEKEKKKDKKEKTSKTKHASVRQKETERPGISTGTFATLSQSAPIPTGSSAASPKPGSTPPLDGYSPSRFEDALHTATPTHT